jgi:hypothetical protein
MLTWRRAPAGPLVLAVLALTSACELADPTAGGPLLTLSVSDRTITANNIATTTITASLRQDTDADVEVTFATNAGRFLTSSTAETNSLKRTTEDRVAEVLLQTDDRPALVVVTATAGSVSAFDTLRFEPGAPDTLLLTANRTVADADGNTTISLTATLSMSDPLAKPTQGTAVVFSARDSGGTLEPTLERRGTSGPNGTVQVDLTSTVPDIYAIYAAVDGGPADTLMVEFTAN